MQSERHAETVSSACAGSFSNALSFAHPLVISLAVAVQMLCEASCVDVDIVTGMSYDGLQVILPCKAMLRTQQLCTKSVHGTTSPLYVLSSGSAVVLRLVDRKQCPA